MTHTGPAGADGARTGAGLPGRPLPVDGVLDEVVAALAGSGTAVLEAPPGAGKTTRLPLALLARDQPGRIVVLEPRRVAARAAAARLAQQLGTRVGEAVGVTTRDERRRSAATRIEVVTEGVLLRRLQRDPSLAGTATLVLDEFHERNLEADLALAFAWESRTALRDDLELVVASATLDGQRVAALLDDAPVVRAEGRRFPVAVEHRDRPPPGSLEQAVADTVTGLLVEEEGDILVFLPGAREIRRTARLLEGVVAGTPPSSLPGTGRPSVVGTGGPAAAVEVLPLHGAMSPAEQDAALAPARPGVRKVVLSTDLAESSVTIDGVRVVIDAGLAREPRFDARSGLSGLVTVPASQAAAEQRAGRAGRTAPGRCVRLWPAREHAARDAHPRPAIATDDLTPAALEVAAWGAQIAELRLLDQPPPAVWAAALGTLEELGALDTAGRLTSTGRRLAALPVHPRLGRLLLTAAEAGAADLGAELAAVLGDRDLLRPSRDRPDADLATRLEVLRRGRAPGGSQVRRGTVQRARRERDRLRRAISQVTTGVDGQAAPATPPSAGALVLSAWPQQLAAARASRRGGYLLAGGRGAELDPRDPLAGEPWLAVAHLDRGAEVARIHLAAAVDEGSIRRVLADRLERCGEVGWRDGDVVAEERVQVGAVVLDRRRIDHLDDAQRLAALLAGLSEEGIGLLDVRDADRQLQARVALLARALGAPFEPVGDDRLLAEASTLLAPFLLRVRNREGLARQRLMPILEAAVGHRLVPEVERLAPTHLTVPSGSRRPVDYTAGEQPVLAVRLQELFGATTTPTVVDGRVPVLLHLLSPAARPVQVTDDLEGFWRRAYPEVRAELRGRYPKHAWPEDPLTAAPLRGAQRRGR